MMGQSNTQEIWRLVDVYDVSLLGRVKFFWGILLMISGPEKSDHPIGLDTW